VLECFCTVGLVSARYVAYTSNNTLGVHHMENSGLVKLKLDCSVKRLFICNVSQTPKLI